MHIKLFPHGKGNGDTPTRYLVRLDYPARQDNPPEVLRGDPDMTRALIDTLETQWKFSAGVLAWHPDDKITPEQEERVMDDFEALAFAGLEPDQRNILWVRHSHASHHELHFVIPRLELSSGKAFNAFPPGWEKHFGVFRNLHNHRESWARPDDPARARLHTPEHADLHKARLIRWGKKPGKDERAEAADAVHAYMAAKLEQELVKNRQDVLAALREAGLEINRAGKDYITVKDPESGEKLRLKGGMYAEQWEFTHPGRADQDENRAGRPGDLNPDPETVRELERELVRLIESRATYNRKRYPQRYRGIGEEPDLPLPEPGGHLQPEISALHSPERGDSGGDPDHLLGTDCPVPSADNRLTPGGGGIIHAKNRNGEYDSGLAHDSTQREQRAIHRADPAAHPEKQLDIRRANCLETGVNHDRTGKNAQGHSVPAGTGLFTFSGRAGQDAGGTAAAFDSAEPSATPTSGREQPDQGRFASLDAALGKLGRIVRELGTALVAFERYIEQRLELARERERQRSRGPGMRM
ncbi:MAG: relaxase/mobilization nuclease domain-containing protein [Desulfovibrio sp.]|jgi:hypothetical protein|nr:relaxase/mobilization nuclease domain-containing protein [Desulfovibrio sp.]